MNKVEKAVSWAIGIAEDDSHGYTQEQFKRWGDDFDCSSLVITAFEEAGIPVKTKGATYTGNMHSAFKKCGFVEVDKNDLKRGDVLLNKKHHTAIYIGDGKIVQASINEKGTTTGGKTGDQTGREILIRDYYEPRYEDGKNGWDVVLRYPENDEDASNSSGNAPVSSSQDSDEEFYIVKKGDSLSKIGAKYGVSVSDLVKWNGIKNPDLILVGQKIKIKDNVAEKPPEYFEGRVTTKSLPLRVRAKASTNSDVLRLLQKGSIVKIAYEAEGWGKLYGGAGFVSMEFITKL